ncbi:Rieske (2Fe-2S) protein [Marinobacter mobilis]|uniref:Ferredoxin subunit of nitrite reductase or a ring-hydroxylating dioxygenase n=1 Tax=Marinobacter mobilis TaxID=488533 RepID=A0A1H2XEV0_9GAMM|nr:Rieske (2Fe-2S) protein [Marinobacter mobilis]SDW91238.1 Ferredoxin subunit of nitrite reductase or a ring-hydroxylating dioxygenase [Marinobacter mobilis]
MTDSSWHTACALNALEDKQAAEFTLDDTPGFVIAHKGELRAYVNRCPHLGIELNWMPGRFLDAEQCFIQCATHGALFSLDKGLCIAGPCQGEALQQLDTRIDQDQILVRFPE